MSAGHEKPAKPAVEPMSAFFFWLRESVLPPKPFLEVGVAIKKDFMNIKHQTLFLVRSDCFLGAVWKPNCKRPFGSRSRVGPLPTGIKFPFTIKMPKWYWDMEDERALAA